MSSFDTTHSNGPTTSASDKAGVASLLLEVSASNAAAAAAAAASSSVSSVSSVSSASSLLSLDNPSLPFPYPIRRVSIDPGSHKYVLVTALLPTHLSSSSAAGTTNNNSDLVTFVRSQSSAEYHKDAAGPLVSALGAASFRDVKILGGGRITRTTKTTTTKVHIFGYSIGFGKADHAMAKAVVEQYGAEDGLGEGTTVTWSDDGY